MVTLISLTVLILALSMEAQSIGQGLIQLAIILTAGIVTIKTQGDK